MRGWIILMALLVFSFKKNELLLYKTICVLCVKLLILTKSFAILLVQRVDSHAAYEWWSKRHCLFYGWSANVFSWWWVKSEKHRKACCFQYRYIKNCGYFLHNINEKVMQLIVIIEIPSVSVSLIVFTLFLFNRTCWSSLCCFCFSGRWCLCVGPG